MKKAAAQDNKNGKVLVVVLLLALTAYLVYASNAFFMSGTERLIAEKNHRHGGEICSAGISSGHRIADRP